MRSFASPKALEQIDFVCRRYGTTPSLYLRTLNADYYTDVTTYEDGSVIEVERRLFDDAHMAFCFDEAAALAGIYAERRAKENAQNSAEPRDPRENGTARTGPVDGGSRAIVGAGPKDAVIFETPYGETGIRGTIPFIGKRDR